ncbi:MAG: hypothetical protein K0S37_2489 [Microbacterium sp.]|nr:hypothetical protein [Microbacterium sp.]
MSEEPQDESGFPPAWHPDPLGGGQLRWWDGSRWTEHLAPVPEQVAAVADTGETPDATAPAVASEPVPGVAAVTAPPREKSMTATTWAVLAATVLVVGGVSGGLWWGSTSARADIQAQAPAVLDGFLAAATAGDATWTDFASPALGSSALAMPLFGDAKAAASIDLAVTYEAGPLAYGRSSVARDELPDGNDAALALVDLTYTFTVDGQQQTATTTQSVWLSRPFYYGDDTPAQARYDQEPTSAGPWRVSGFTAPTSGDLQGREALAASSYVAAEDDSVCRSAIDLLARMSELARENNFIPALCLSGGRTTTVGDDVDVDAIGKSFPALTYLSPFREATSVEGSYDNPAPLQEYRITIGDADYIFVLAAVGEQGQRSSEAGWRIISIQRAGE